MTTYINGDNIIFTNNSGKDIVIKAANGRKLILQNVETATTSYLQATNFIGQVAAFPLSETTGGFLPCNGKSFSKVEYPLLYEKLGDTFGEDDTTFNVPDYSSVSPGLTYSIFTGLPSSGITYGTQVVYSFTGAGRTQGDRFLGATRTYVSGDQSLCTILSNDSFKLPTNTVGRRFTLECNYLGASAEVSLPLVKEGLGITVEPFGDPPDGTETTLYLTGYEFVQTAADAIFEFRTPQPPDSYYPVTPILSTGTFTLRIL